MWAMGWMMLGMLLFWGLLIFAAIWLVKRLFQSGTSQITGTQDGLTPKEMIDFRYSRGEITREQYDQIKIDIEK